MENTNQKYADTNYKSLPTTFFIIKDILKILKIYIVSYALFWFLHSILHIIFEITKFVSILFFQAILS